MTTRASQTLLLATTTAAALLLLLLSTPPTASARPLAARLGGYNSDAATLTLHFYTKDSSLLDRDQAAAIRAVLSQHVFMVPQEQVSSVCGLAAVAPGQLTATFLGEGPAFNSRSVLGNCQNNIPAMFGNRLFKGRANLHNMTQPQQLQPPQQVKVVGSSEYWLDVVQGVKRAECAPA